MRLVREVAELREVLRGREGVGFVPTMGALHEGHLALVRTARRENALVVVSIFVNPLQFGPGEDYERYPRDLEGDLEKLERETVDVVFAPSRTTMYPEGAETVVEVGRIGAVLEGAARPGHFRGVATVVLKLLHLVAPATVYFGQKDWQQTLVVRQLLRDLFLSVRMRVVPTVREADGLAMSSRNLYLSPLERERATCLYRALEAGFEALRQGARETSRVEAAMRAVLEAEAGVAPDYAAAREASTLAEVSTLQGEVVLAVAAKVGTARLIDNFVVAVEGASARLLGGADGWMFQPPAY